MAVRATGVFRPIVVTDGGAPAPAARGPGRNYGAPKVDLGTGLGRIRDGGRPPKELKKKVLSHIEGMMAARGRELTAELPPVYRKQLDSTVNSFRDAGRSEKDLAALRFAVAQKLTQLLR